MISCCCISKQGEPDKKTIQKNLTQDRYTLFKNIFNDKQYIGYCKRIIDGDTFQANVYIPSLSEQIVKMTIRLYKINTPELKTHDIIEKRHAKTCSDMLKYLIYNHYIHLQCYGLDSFGRLLCDVYLYATYTPMGIYHHTFDMNKYHKINEEYIHINKFMLDHTPAIPWKKHETPVYDFSKKQSFMYTNMLNKNL